MALSQYCHILTSLAMAAMDPVSYRLARKSPSPGPASPLFQGQELVVQGNARLLGYRAQAQQAAQREQRRRQGGKRICAAFWFSLW